MFYLASYFWRTFAIFSSTAYWCAYCLPLKSPYVKTISVGQKAAGDDFLTAWAGQRNEDSLTELTIQWFKRIKQQMKIQRKRHRYLTCPKTNETEQQLDDVLKKLCNNSFSPAVQGLFPTIVCVCACACANNKIETFKHTKHGWVVFYYKYTTTKDFLSRHLSLMRPGCPGYV